MKKLLLFCALSVVLGVYADETLFPASCANYPTSYLQLGIWYNFPRSQMESNVFGAKTGWPMCGGSGSITGLEASWLGSLTNYINGAQLGWTLAYNRRLRGLQATLITCISTEKLIGVQLAPVFNKANEVKGLQASCINVSGDFTGFQPAAILNVSDNVTGFQAAPILNVADDVNGVQAGLINKAKAVKFQLGLINTSTSGFQIGMLNFMDNAWIPVFPVLNFGFAK